MEENNLPDKLYTHKYTLFENWFEPVWDEVQEAQGFYSQLKIRDIYKDIVNCWINNLHHLQLVDAELNSYKDSDKDDFPVTNFFISRWMGASTYDAFKLVMEKEAEIVGESKKTDVELSLLASVYNKDIEKLWALDIESRKNLLRGFLFNVDDYKEVTHSMVSKIGMLILLSLQQYDTDFFCINPDEEIEGNIITVSKMHEFLVAMRDEGVGDLPSRNPNMPEATREAEDIIAQASFSEDYLGTLVDYMSTYLDFPSNWEEEWQRTRYN